MLKEIRLQNFRCFESLRFRPEAETSFIIGSNAQGKTSILEAICCLLRLQSPRTATMSETVKMGAASFVLQGTFADTHLQFEYPPRTITLDGKVQSRATDYLKTGLVAWFSNEDMDLIRGGGSGRRRYLDFLASQIDGTYLPSLRAYERALRSRNLLLKQPNARRQEVEAWNKPLLEAGEVLLRRRKQIIEALAPHVRACAELISGSPELVEITYQPGADGDFHALLEATLEEERRQRVTTVGPHRDDIRITLHGANASSFASEGQQRTIALALKLAQARVLEEETKRTPIFLIDDIFGELDVERRNRLMAALPVHAQRMITTTHLSWLKEYATASIFELSNRKLMVKTEIS